MACFRCRDGYTPLYCLNCAYEMRQNEMDALQAAMRIELDAAKGKCVDLALALKSSVCSDHEWPYGFDLDGDNRPKCVWCEALRADALEGKLVDAENMLQRAEWLLSHASPNDKCATLLHATLTFDEEWAQAFGKWWAQRKHGTHA